MRVRVRVSLRGGERLAVGELEQLLQLLVGAEDRLRLLAHLLLLVAHALRTRPRLLAIRVVDEVVHLLLVVLDLLLALRGRLLRLLLPLLLPLLSEELLAQLLLSTLHPARRTHLHAHLHALLLLLRQPAEPLAPVVRVALRRGLG